MHKEMNAAAANSIPDGVIPDGGSIPQDNLQGTEKAAALGALFGVLIGITLVILLSIIILLALCFYSAPDYFVN